MSGREFELGAASPTLEEEGTQRKNVAPFAIYGTVDFAPDLFPETIRVTKQRNLDRTEHFCKGEDVTDNGSKNRDIHITGKMRGTERDYFDALLEVSDPAVLTSATWSGEVRVAEGEYEGPTGYHPPSGDLYWQYTIDLVSTGATSREGETTDAPGSAPTSRTTQ